MSLCCDAALVKERVTAKVWGHEGALQELEDSWKDLDGISSSANECMSQ